MIDKLSPREIAEEIVRREGGYVNNANDLGGATNFGVTIGTLKSLGLDLDKDGDVDVADLKQLTAEKAAEIFLEHYYYRPRIDQLPNEVSASVFDMFVNAGNNAVKILQRLLNSIPNGSEMLSVDGGIGPKTVASANLAAADMGDYLYSAYGIARRNYYFTIADRRAKNRVFARTTRGKKGGWIKRAEEFMDPRYHMTAEEFDARVREWT